MLFYLGPEIIAALQGVYERTRENSQASDRPSQRSVDECDVIPAAISSWSLPCSPVSAVAIRVTVRLLP